MFSKRGVDLYNPRREKEVDQEIPEEKNHRYQKDKLKERYLVEV